MLGLLLGVSLSAPPLGTTCWNVQGGLRVNLYSQPIVKVGKLPTAVIVQAAVSVGLSRMQLLGAESPIGLKVFGVATDTAYSRPPTQSLYLQIWVGPMPVVLGFIKGG